MSYWKAPQSNTSVEFPIVLSGLSDVSGVAIIVSSCGYSSSDCPIVRCPNLRYFFFFMGCSIYLHEWYKLSQQEVSSPLCMRTPRLLAIFCFLDKLSKHDI
jgi:hypothetical protein